MEFIRLVMQLIDQAAQQLERLEQLLIRVGLALWHILGTVFLFYMLLAEKTSKFFG
jgi:hypothetical protein